MTDIAERYEKIKQVYLELSAMPDVQMEHVEALGVELAELMNDTSAAIAESSPEKNAIILILQVLARAIDAIVSLDGVE